MSRSIGRRLRRGPEVLGNLGLAASVVALHVTEDPLLLLLQVSRRLPRPVVTAASRGLLVGTGPAGRRRPCLRSAFGTWLVGDAGEATALTRAARRAPSGVARRLLDELAVQLGEPVEPQARGRAGASLRARAAWARGDLSGAVEHAAGGGTRLAARMRSELELLSAPAPLPTRRAAHTVRRSPPRVLHLLTNSLPHTTSGYAQRSHAVLRAQRAAGLEVLAVTRLGYPVAVGALLARHEDVVDDVVYRRLLPTRLAPTADGRVRQQVELLLPLARAFAPTVLHTTTNHVNALITAALAERLGVPWVYEVRGQLEETWVASRPAGAEQERAARSERYRLLRQQEGRVAAAADAVVTLSRTLSAELVGRGVDPARVTVVPNGVDDAVLGPTVPPDRARREVGLPPDGFWVGTVSSLVDYEGLDTLVDAVALLRRRDLDVRLAVVGDGVSRGPLERRAREAGLATAAVFRGRVPHASAQLHHRALDVFVVPRRDVRVCRQVTPLKPIEAMAAGRPVVASDLPALAELLEPHGSGLLVPAGDAPALADALQRLHGSPALRRRCGEAGRAFAATRTWASAGATYRRLYESLTLGAAA